MILELRNICKSYEQGKLEVPVLKNISLSVQEGEYLAIMGPSGSGKTTLMNIIGCLDTPTSGEYYLQNEELSSKTDVQLSAVRLRSIGFVFQSFHLLPRQSALENVALPLLYAGVKKAERNKIARAALERVGLGERIDFKPTQLSGGQCQRVAIARAMVNDPKILLADEPTGALDTASGEQIMELFHTLHQQGVTIVMITHEPDIAAHAERVLHIRDGALVDEPLSIAPSKPTAKPEVPQETLVFATREFRTFHTQREHPIEIDAIVPEVKKVEPSAPKHVEVNLPVAKAKPIEIDAIVPEVKKVEPSAPKHVEVNLPVTKAKPIEIDAIVPEIRRVKGEMPEKPAPKKAEQATHGKTVEISAEQPLHPAKPVQPTKTATSTTKKLIDIEAIIPNGENRG